ncbi:MAG: hypothetical protein A2942_02270 [Candidatus Lloydbacteria bacterium RIFCSPLOWO2_01_FULL_50_20]|uniref:Response regulatory domain-containing protein n=1 Tax=Candidatus Lloydbacteria bacterium RIFCSPLOWO2_01_FULL_50_20 TaxID=1798665 RepID=A0A1G2DGW7_9BACT|nr:MAG: hypothetical protein A3C13_03220 [Candidatus Lloydbacteria bacterium RIFCSPHIGHO2_02_FULL_50_11]OGZ12028.1 MAG: hypothetical protein A2942_02270 [Candidatus Lloydbacteria bacterium RIFCSPLOWO2_01_FULL_50_20]
MAKEKTAHSIFVIDDDTFLLDMYALKFTEEGFQVSTSAGTLEALEKLRGGAAPEIILVDLVTPAMDGFAFLEQLHKENLVPNTLIIILSNLGQQDDINRALKLGAAGYIIKASNTPTEVVNRVIEELKKCEKK